MLLSIWEVLKEPLMAGVFGFLVGLFNHARKNKRKIVFPRKLKGSWDLGFIYDCMESAIGAFALVLLVGPSDWLRIFLVGLIGALNAEVVFNVLLNHLKQLTDKSINNDIEKDIKSEDDKENRNAK